MTKAHIHSLMSFLDTSPTPWHAVNNSLSQLTHSTLLKENEKWKLEPHKTYHVVRDGCALCAFKTPRHLPKKAIIVATHTDSPSLKIKPLGSLKSQNLLCLRSEVYGSPLLNGWLNKDLALAGRVHYVDHQNTIQSRCINLDTVPLMITQLPPHLDPDLKEKGLKPNPQDHLLAIMGIGKEQNPKEFLTEILKQHLKTETLLSEELFLYPLEKSRLLGIHNDLLASARIDNLASLSASLEAFQHAQAQDHIPMIISWNHEEVGSETPQGAGSSFLEEILERISLSLSPDRSDFFILKQQSCLLSVDMAHGIHPGFENKHDPQHPILLSQGVVIKTNAKQRYLTHSYSEARLKKLAHDHKIPLQTFVARSDAPCGSTIGPIQGTRSGIPTLDLGIGQLSMHSTRELMSCQDYLYLIDLLKIALNSL